MHKAVLQSYFFKHSVIIRVINFLLIFLTFSSHVIYANTKDTDAIYSFATKKPLSSIQGSFLAWQQQCAKKNYNSCMLLGRTYFEGYGVLPNILLAQKFFTLACNNQNLESCLIMHELANKKDNVYVLTLYKQACDLNHVQSCKELGENLSHTITPQSPLAEKQQALRVIRKTCELQGDSVCLHAKTFENVFVQQKSDEMIFQKKLQECHDAQETNQNSLAVCGEVGEIYGHAMEVEQNKKKALQYYSIACHGGHNEFCFDVVLDPILNP